MIALFPTAFAITKNSSGDEKKSSGAKNKTRKILFSIIRITLGVYIGLTIFLFFFQRYYIYRPMKEIIITPAALGLDYEDIIFEAADGVKLSGWFVPAREPKGVVLFCHSNAGNISTYLDSVKLLNGLGLSVFIFDYRSYGDSEGKPTEQGTYMDAEAAWRYLIEKKGFSNDEMIILGRSLGGAVGSHLARKHTPKALIIESSFTSFDDIAKVHFPYVPIRLIARYNYNVVDNLQNVKCPVLIVHSRDDEIVPFRMGRKLFEYANEPKGFLEITGDHNECYTLSGKRYTDGLSAFIAEYVVKQ